MASSRTKGFFEQEQRSKHHYPWNNKQHRDRTPLSDAPTNIPRKPPIPATAHAKSKLKAFEFDADHQVVPAGESKGDRSKARTGSDTGNEDREDLEEQPADTARQPHSTTDGADSPSAAKRAGHGASEQPSHGALQHSNSFPCTPGARLSLDELIGNFDDRNLDKPVECSPQEQIGWVPNSSSTPNRRKRKRAKSSSPTAPASSSQPNQNSAQKGFLAAGRTPAADPVTDLWQRYATSKSTGEGLRVPEVSNLVFQGSPRALETPVKGGGLRRWASTGNDWPTSKNKRRCTSSKSTISVWQEQTALETGNTSKVASMVQQLQATLTTQKPPADNQNSAAVMPDLPTSSSPQPEVPAQPQMPSSLQSRTADVLAQTAVATPQIEEQRPKSAAHAVRLTQSGGIRFDASKQTGDPWNPGAAPTYSLQSKAPLPAYKRPSITRTPSLPKIPVPAASAAPASNKDEFDDDDFDLTVDDLDELCSQRPAKQPSLQDKPPQANSPTQFVQSVNTLSWDVNLQEPQQRYQGTTITLDDNDEDDDDEFGDGDIDEDSFAQAEYSATQTLKISSHMRSPRRLPWTSRHSQYSGSPDLSRQAGGRLQRYVVQKALDSNYVNEKGHRSDEKLLMADDERTKRRVVITLRGSWTSMPVGPQVMVHVAHVKRSQHQDLRRDDEPPGQITISDNEHSPLLIIHPDHMLSATTVADSFDCVRKAVLQDRIKATGETSKAMVYGKILHEVFQHALSANQWDDVFLAELVSRTVEAHVEGLWELGMRDNVLAEEEVKGKMGEVTAWAKVFIRPEPGPAAQVDERQGEKVLMSISKLIAIEEHVWSPQYGLKGNVDATCQTTVLSRPGAPDSTNLIVPFEVKTGKTTQSAAHRAQTALYTLLMSDRYDVAVEAGILYYLESSSMSRIAPPLAEIRQMIQQRNRLASYIFHARNPANDLSVDGRDAIIPTQEIGSSGLPAMLLNPFKCGRCYAQQSCFTYHALVEAGTAETAGMLDDNKRSHSLTWKEAVEHLQGGQKDLTQANALKRWFAKWDKLLTFEESNQMRLRKELWTMTSTEREATGRCFGNLIMTKDLNSETTETSSSSIEGVEGAGGKINRYAYVFSRARSTPTSIFTEGSQLSVGEPIVVSSEQGQWALANGYITAISRSEITVGVDRKLGRARERLPGFDADNNQAFKGTMTVGHSPQGRGELTRNVYRIDKDEFSNGLAMVRNNLVALMSNHPLATKLRSQVVFDVAPMFQDQKASSSMLQPTQLGEMNDDQHSAVAKVLSADDYALILGMPGTGKTTTIAHIIRALMAEGKSILLTSFTHTAVDNILLKIRDIAPPGSILRLGVPAKINSQVQEFCQLAATVRKSIDEVEASYMGTQIVATTCMGTNHALFNRRSFDVCIVDEASQITLPTILGPLLHARTFVLVGDHYQLPPLVQNKAALEGGLDVSLFKQLSEAQPEAVAELGRQYRMCEEVMSLSNDLVYHGKLRCGNEKVARRTLQLEAASNLQLYHGPDSTCQSSGDSHCWLNRATEPRHKVVFANTDALGKNARETLSGGGKITNNLEATLAAQLVLSLLALGVPGPEIGVITLYRSQLALMRQLFRRAGIPSTVEIDSADRFQGRDKECIILSMVRSNEAGIVGDLLKDWRRVNVALTRAKSKLLVLGSRTTLKNNELLAKMIRMMEDNEWLFDLPHAADEAHVFDFSTQVAEEIVARQSPSPKKRQHKSPSKGPQRSPTKSTLSPIKSESQRSPLKRPLQPSSSAGNVSPKKPTGMGKKSPKVIKGGTGSLWNSKVKRAREQVVAEIFEHLTGDEF